MNAQPLWAITPFYNPAGYSRRLQNFHAFRRNLQLPLLVIELAAPGRHQLTDADADKVIHLTGEDRIWQKERLINIAIGALPQDTDFIAWLDCDVLFENQCWSHDACTLLDNGNAIVQLFESVIHMPRQFEPELASRSRCRAATPMFREQSFAHCFAAGSYFEGPKRPTRADVEDADGSFAAPPVSHGVAWAARRDLLAEHGLYDACIIGGGDKALAMAIIGQAETLAVSRPMAARHADHYLEWARRILAGTNGRVDVVPGAVYHLWHGSYKLRRYEQRHTVLEQLEFDPYRDLELHTNGTWRWSGAAGSVKESVGEYFFDRREDG